MTAVTTCGLLQRPHQQRGGPLIEPRFGVHQHLRRIGRVGIGVHAGLPQDAERPLPRLGSRVRRGLVEQLTRSRAAGRRPRDSTTITISTTATTTMMATSSTPNLMDTTVAGRPEQPRLTPHLCQPRLTAMEATDLAALAADTREPRAGLRAVAALRRLADALELAQVESALAAGLGWSDIAGELGVSRQAVHKKFAHRVSTRIRKATR